MDERFKVLELLDAGDFQHSNGDLESHLKGTATVLKSWGASELLQTAGMFHAAYGIDGLNQKMISLEQRDSIAKMIGLDEEALIYFYCSCYREFVYPHFISSEKIQFRDRFNGDIFLFKGPYALMFCELTVANELELVYSSDAFKMEHGKGLLKLFTGMNSYLSYHAKTAFTEALENNSQ